MVTNYASRNFLLVLLVFTAGLNFNNQLLAQGPKSIDPELAVLVKKTLKENAEVLQFVQNKGQFPVDSVLFYLDSRQGTVFY